MAGSTTNLGDGDNVMVKTFIILTLLNPFTDLEPRPEAARKSQTLVTAVQCTPLAEFSVKKKFAAITLCGSGKWTSEDLD